jgi:hypothetical protein
MQRTSGGGSVGATMRAGGLALAAMIASAGCMVPPYHLPAGFSSSYQRQLYGMEPVGCSACDQGIASIETRPGVFFPTSVYREPTMIAIEQREKESMEPLFLDADPLTSKKTAQRAEQ